MTSNYVDASGLHLQSLTGIIGELETGFKSIYGADINIDPNSPDGQMINLFAQAKIDMLDCIAQVYGSFSPSSAVGVVLDQRCALNGVARHGATKTAVPVDITFDRDVALVGVNDATTTPFTVSDGSGNQFYLVTGFTGATGTTGQPFIAVNAGAVEVTVGGITKIETITTGVISVNNSLQPTVRGVDEETDVALRLRRAVSVSEPSQGYLDGINSSLLALTDVTHAVVYENTSGATGATADGSIPPHSIWAVVEGGTGPDIADVLYRKRSAGCGMKGGVTGVIGQSNGFDFTARWDWVTLQNLYISLTMTSLTGSHSPDTTYLKNYIVDNMTYGINQPADYSAIAALVKAADPLAVIISGFVGSTGSTGASYKYPTSIDSRWVISSAHITTTVV